MVTVASSSASVAAYVRRYCATGRLGIRFPLPLAAASFALELKDGKLGHVIVRIGDDAGKDAASKAAFLAAGLFAEVLEHGVLQSALKCPGGNDFPGFSVELAFIDLAVLCHRQCDCFALLPFLFAEFRDGNLVAINLGDSAGKLICQEETGTHEQHHDRTKHLLHRCTSKENKAILPAPRRDCMDMEHMDLLSPSEFTAKKIKHS